MGNQMILVLLALALFSTIMMNMYNLILDDAKIVYNSMLYIQGQKNADKYFQQIEAEMMGSSPLKTFSQAYTDYSSIASYENIGGSIYYISLNTSYCDSLGNTAYPDSTYMKVDVQMTVASPAGDTLYIGTQNNPFSTVFFSSGS
ncbi:MAG: hypothetical protein Q7J16_04360 [Candidatus Cloacimonadales bacterium]|nr:hypothetical protein [Candidatus Cloacimonadales bacterium]